MFERVLVPLDGPKRAARAVPIAARMASATDGTVILVSVVNHFVLLEYPERERDNRRWISDDLSMGEAEAYLEQVAHSPELAHVRVEKVILSGPIAFTLLSAATACRADLIVLTSRDGSKGKRQEPPPGHNGDSYHRTLPKMSAGLRAGSVAEKVVSRARIPVLVLSENGEREVLYKHGCSDRGMLCCLPIEGVIIPSCDR